MAQSEDLSKSDALRDVAEVWTRGEKLDTIQSLLKSLALMAVHPFMDPLKKCHIICAMGQWTEDESV